MLLSGASVPIVRDKNGAYMYVALPPLTFIMEIPARRLRE